MTPIEDETGWYVDEDNEGLYSYTVNDVEVSKEDYERKYDYYDNTYGESEPCYGQYELTEAGIAAKLGSLPTTTAITTTTTTTAKATVVITESASATFTVPAAADTDPAVVLTETQRETVVPFLVRLLSRVLAEYNCASPDVEKNLAAQCCFAFFYPTEREMELSAFYDAAIGCYVIPADTFELILKEIFNYSDEAVLKARDNLDYRDGNYFCTLDTNVSSPAAPTITLVRAEYKAPFYYVDYTNDKDETYYAKLQYKYIGDGYYWSIYQNARTPIADFEALTGETATENPSETGTEKTDGEKKIDTGVVKRMAIVILIALAVVAAPAALIVVILKHGGKKQNAQTKEPQNRPVPPVYPESKPEPQPQPRPAQEYRYRCFEAYRAGTCAMCGKQTDALMQIDAIKGDKINTRYFCRSCAAGIMRKVGQKL